MIMSMKEAKNLAKDIEQYMRIMDTSMGVGYRKSLRKLMAMLEGLRGKKKVSNLLEKITAVLPS